MKDIIKELKNTSSMWKKLKDEKRRVLIYGMGDGAVKLLQILNSLGVEVIGVFASDDFVRYQSFSGFQVKKLSDYEREFSDFTILSAFATRLDEVRENFFKISKKHPFLVPDINVSGDHLELFDEDFIDKFGDRINAFYSALDDDGREFLEYLVYYKFTGDIKYLDKIEKKRTSTTLPFDKDSVLSFADLGAYVGDTLRDAVETYPNLQRAVAYEPDARSFKKLVKTAEGLNIELFPINALTGDKVGKVTLRSGGAMNTIIEDNVKENSSFQKKKCVVTDMTTLDASLPFSPDLIKIDVEGCEKITLIGAEKTISKSAPVLKVSIYHNHRDLFEIYEKISAIKGGYRYTIRQKCKYIPAWDIELIAF